MATYDIGVFKGHGNYTGGFDPGACANGRREFDIVSKIVDEAVQILKSNGISVLTGENYYNNDLLSNHTITSKAIYSVHCNSGGGRRTEFLVPKGEKFFDTENEIGKEMVKLGIPTYKIKSKDYDTETFIDRVSGTALGGLDWYKEIRQAWKKGISLTIFETGFIDSSDVDVLVNKTSDIAKILACNLAKLCNKTIKPPVTEKPNVEVTNKKYLNLLPHVKSWRVYPMNVSPTVGNECAKLAPSQYGGLSYEIIEDRGNVKVITTQMFGKVQIFAPRDEDSTITNYPTY